MVMEVMVMEVVMEGMGQLMEDLEMILVDLAMVGNETLLFIYLFMYLVTINK